MFEPNSELQSWGGRRGFGKRPDFLLLLFSDPFKVNKLTQHGRGVPLRYKRNKITNRKEKDARVSSNFKGVSRPIYVHVDSPSWNFEGGQ